MPTGYTSIIEERDVTFAEFAKRCARAMGGTMLRPLCRRRDNAAGCCPDWTAGDWKRA